jgi:hypothetical protein
MCDNSKVSRINSYDPITSQYEANKMIHNGTVLLLTESERLTMKRYRMNNEKNDGVITKVNKRIRPSKSAKKLSVYQSIGRKLLVIDLNGVLIHRTSLHNYVARPYMYDFLNFISDRCDIAIWTSATTKTMKKLISTLFTFETGFDKSRFLFMWSQTRCAIETPETMPVENTMDGNELITTTNDVNDVNIASVPTITTTSDLMNISNTPSSPWASKYSGKPLYWKETATVWAEYPQFKYTGGTYILDDSFEKLARNPPSTSVIVPTFTSDSAQNGDDTVLRPCGQFWNHIRELTTSQS